MGYLSYLDDFKNLENLKEEMQLYTNTEDENDQFEVLLFSGKDQDIRGIVGVQIVPNCIVIRYLSLDPSYRNNQTREVVMQELKQYYPKQEITTLPDYTYLLPFLRDEDSK
ncbi:riboflavin biosynthesis RibT protein [Lactobacillus colini]|uniref:Riboflavin biosynthesis RibT protein n=1 Tax=Lactobacillus colini TaxID=1819254 RepID=A0ABS4MF30_9LACO|nr:riboflavin biosynthesis RibT protein [Lactobacillus colini]